MERPHSGGVFGIVAELVSRLSMRKDAVVIEMTGERLEAALLGRHPA
ncbi:hypothetical protein ACH4MW_13340 [Streptomyces luteogriseus]